MRGHHHTQECQGRSDCWRGGLGGGESRLPRGSGGGRRSGRSGECAKGERVGGEDRPHTGDSTERMHECSVLKDVRELG